MNILYIVPGLPTRYDPNRMIWIADQARSLSKYHKIHICVMEPLVHYLKFKYLKIFLETLSLPGFVSGSPDIAVHPVRYWALPGYYKYRSATYPIMLTALLEYIKKHIDMSEIDLIHSYFSLPSGMLAKTVSAKYNKPYIVSELASNIDFTFDMGDDIAGVLKKAAYVVTISPYMEEWLLKRVPIPDEKRSIIPMGIDFFKFDPDISKRSRNKTPRLLFVAGLVPHKGCHILLHALHILKKKNIDFSLDIVGRGPEETRLKKLAEELGIAGKVGFLGFLEKHADLEKLYSGSDIFILSSFTEGQGVVVIEAMACGTPVIATKCGGPEMFVNEISGKLVEPGNPVMMAEAIEYVLDNYDSYDPAAIRKYAEEKFSLPKIAGKINELYLQKSVYMVE